MHPAKSTLNVQGKMLGRVKYWVNQDYALEFNVRMRWLQNYFLKIIVSSTEVHDVDFERQVRIRKEFMKLLKFCQGKLRQAFEADIKVRARLKSTVNTRAK